MDVIALQSGSSGNCVFVESGDVQLLFDAGISGRQAQERLARHGKDICNVKALVISHDHRDHTACMGIYQRKFGIPIYVTEETFATVSQRMKVGKTNDIRHFESGDSLQIGHVTIETLATPHDAADGVAFVIDDGRRRFGLFTDLGHVFGRLQDVMPSLDGVLVESNYDPQMLEYGPYPTFLKERIRGPQGHLSNKESAELLKCAHRDKLQWACLAHLSDENNDPDVALNTHHEILGPHFPLKCADRLESTEVFSL